MNDLDHQIWQERVFALYDGELAPDERSEALRHLEACSDCRGLLARWNTIAGAMLKPRAPLPVSERLVQGVMARIEARKQARDTWSPVPWRWAVPALALALGLLILALPAALQEPPVAAEALLLADNSDGGAADWMFAHESPAADELLGYVLEQP
jgi:anti-sigma factor RsiW